MHLSFFSFLLLFLLCCHFFVYYFLVRLFNLSNKKLKLKLGLIITSILVGVIVTLYLFNIYDNSLIRIAYAIFASWMGIVINIILLAFLLLFFKKIFTIFKIKIATIYFRYTFILLIVIISIISFYRALSPTVSSYEVFVKDLPLAWENKTIVHISDLHLGPIYRANFLNRVVDRINLLEPEAVFISGDFFDGRRTDFSWLNHLLDAIITKKGIFYGFGNHDLYLGADKAKEIINSESLVILDNKMLEVDGLQIIGLDYLSDISNTNGDLLKEVLEDNNYNENQPSILIFHAPLNIETFKEAKIDLQLSGHTHDGQLFPFNYLVKLVHDGYGYGLFSEGDFNLIVSAGLGTWGPPMRTAHRSEIVEIVLRKK